MTKGEIIAAILDYENLAGLREIQEVLHNRIARLGSGIVDGQIAPLMGQGKTVRVEVRWSDGSMRKAKVIKVNRKRVLVDVEGMPVGRSTWNVTKMMITRVIEE